MAGTSGKAIHYKGLEGVLAGYKMHGTPYYALFQDKQILFAYDDEDETKSLELLKENLQALHAAGSTSLYTIKFYRALEKGFIDRNTQESGSFNFRLVEPGGVTQYTSRSANSFDPAERYFQFLESRNNLLEEELQAMRERLDELAEEEETQDPGNLGMIGVIGKAGEQYPWMQDLLKQGMDWIKNITMNKQPGTTQHRAHGIAGVEDETDPSKKLQTALETLMACYQKKHGEDKGGVQFADDMQKLAALAKDKPFMFDAAITQLRSM